MRLTRELAQPLIDQLLPLVERNINVMDEHGVIVASGDNSRMNQKHQGAEIVLKQKDEYIVRDDSSISGTKAGVNLPIDLNGEIVGVVGITGTPESVYHLAKVVKLTVEVLLKQIDLEKQTRYKEEAIKGWLANLTDMYSFEERRLEEIAKSLSIHYGEKRSVLVVEIHSMDGLANSQNDSSLYLERVNRKKRAAC